MDIHQTATHIEQITGWNDLESLLPPGWREMAVATNALKGLRKDKSPDNFLHVLLLHFACGMSLRETAVTAKLSNLGDFSDVALLKRIRKSEGFLKALCQSMFGAVRLNADLKNYHIRLVDGTTIKEPGQFGTLWRLHYSFSLPDMSCDGFKLTQASGKGSAEGLWQYEAKPNDIIVGDRAFCNAKGIGHVVGNGGHVCVRWNSGALNLLEGDGRTPFDAVGFLRKLQVPGACAEHDVSFAVDGKVIQCRFCAVRKDNASIALAHKRLKAEASRKQTRLRKSTLLVNEYVIVITTLPGEAFPLKSILEIYRLRWQVELVFKRFKSIARLGALPKYTDSSARAWLYGKMLVALLVEKLCARLGAFSPWRHAIGEAGGAEEAGGKELVDRIQILAARSCQMDNAIFWDGPAEGEMEDDQRRTSPVSTKEKIPARKPDF